jgi:hypothetical protein
MHTFESPLGHRSIVFEGVDPFEALAAGPGTGDDLNIRVFIGGDSPWSFDLVLHSNDTVTKPAEADDITVTVTRP